MQIKLPALFLFFNARMRSFNAECLNLSVATLCYVRGAPIPTVVLSIMAQQRSVRRGPFRCMLRRQHKRRTLSLDETISTSHLSHHSSDPEDCLDHSSGSHGRRGQGSLSKATALLLQRRVNNKAPSDVGDVRNEVVLARQEEHEASQALIAPKPLKSCLKAVACGEKTLDPAIRARQDAIRAQQRLLGRCHPDVLFSLESLLRFHRSRGELLEANIVLEEMHRLSRESYLSHLTPTTVPKSIVIFREEP